MVNWNATPENALANRVSDLLFMWSHTLGENLG